jgi:hypothetical protein
MYFSFLRVLPFLAVNLFAPVHPRIVSNWINYAKNKYQFLPGTNQQSRSPPLRGKNQESQNWSKSTLDKAWIIHIITPCCLKHGFRPRANPTNWRKHPDGRPQGRLCVPKHGENAIQIPALFLINSDLIRKERSLKTQANNWLNVRKDRTFLLPAGWSSQQSPLTITIKGYIIIVPQGKQYRSRRKADL